MQLTNQNMLVRRSVPQAKTRRHHHGRQLASHLQSQLKSVGMGQVGNIAPLMLTAGWHHFRARATTATCKTDGRSPSQVAAWARAHARAPCDYHGPRIPPRSRMTTNAAYSRRTGMVAAAAAAAPVQRGCSTGLTGVRSRQACLHGTRGMGVNVRAAPLVLRMLARALCGNHGFCVLQDSACKTRLAMRTVQASPHLVQ